MIYFIKIEGINFVKIGYCSTNNHKPRFRTIKMHTPFELELLLCIEGDKLKERQVHQIFHKDRYSGEWFTYSDKMKEYIKSHPNPLTEIILPISRRKFNYTIEQEQKAVEMYENNINLQEIANYLGSSKAAVKRYMYKKGLTKTII